MIINKLDSIEFRLKELHEFIEWLFHTKSTDYNALPENTSLQMKVKKHLLTGGVIRTAYGRKNDKI